ncbi:uncharacterized protein CDAR_583511 [Caerostris darwini]|uniref:Uncharacterized protein n=1 Tax=Caerostris darwini TaxID=1538125 RepID=A0AAV4PW55_9ARAC|nr:uncharacterized protein CDAR_583511 [Caerostris darwini]
MARSLYSWCLIKINELLLEEFWNTFNPFTFMPSSIVDEIVDSIIDNPIGFHAPSLCFVCDSGQVEHFSLHGVRMSRQIIPVLKSLSVCKKLKALKLTDLDIQPNNVQEASEHLENLFRNSTHLEHLHCGIIFDLKALRACKDLRTIRLNFFPQQPIHEFLDVIGTSKLPHENLQLFTICERYVNRYILNGEIAEVLNHCPNLQSLGCIETSSSLTYLHGVKIQSGEPSPSYQLTKCFWRENKVSKKHCRLNYRGFEDSVIYFGASFFYSVKVAVLLCPLLRELIIEIPRTHYSSIIKSLSNLKNLTLLEIELSDFTHEFRTECLNLLTDIGPKLKHLAIHRFDNVEFDSIFKYCPGLESLKVDCNGVTPDWEENSVNLERLRRLAFFSIDGANVESVEKLFSLCINLEELFLKNPKFLNGNFLKTIKKVNTMNRLKIACICDCSMTEEELKDFVVNATALEKIAFDSSKINDDDAEDLIEEINDNIIVYPDWNTGLKDEFFYRRRYF